MSSQLRELGAGYAVSEFQHEMLDEITVFAFPSRLPRQAKSSMNSGTYGSNSSGIRLSSVDWHYTDPNGDPEEKLDSLPGEIGENGRKTLPDGSVAGVHTSTTTGHRTIQIHRLVGKRDIKIRYPRKEEKKEEPKQEEQKQEEPKRDEPKKDE